MAGKVDLIVSLHRFHCDDALAVGMIIQLHEFRDAVVVRTRDEKIWAKGAIVVDVGGEYDPERNRFDHHQRGFSTTFNQENPKSKIKMSSAGMVFKHFGRRLLNEVYNVPEDEVEGIHKRLYESLIESVDAIDNGVDICEHGNPSYIIRSDLSSRVARLNEEWNEWSGDSVSAERFKKAISMTLEEIGCHMKYYIKHWLPARRIVSKGMLNRFKTHSSGQVIELEMGCPFEEHLEGLEIAEGLGSGENLQKLILFVFYPNTDDGKSWRVKTVKVSKKSFENRLSLPEKLRGLREESLTDMGFPNITFIHHAGFLAGASCRSACLNLINAALAEADQAEK